MADDLADLPEVSLAAVVSLSPVFRCRHEVDLAEWDTLVGSGVSRVTPGLASTIGKARFTLSDTDPRYLENSLTVDGNYLLYRFYLDITNLVMDTDEAFIGQRIGLSDSPDALFEIELGYDGSDFQLTHRAYEDDDSSTDGTPVNIPQEEHWIEIGLRRSGEGTDDGAAVMVIDGYQAQPILGLDNDAIWANIDAFLLGAISGLDAGTSGSFDVDEVVVVDENWSSYF